MTLRLDPAERFLLLAQLLDDVVAPTPETLRAVALASMTALRFTQGRATAVEAIFAVERARTALLDASRVPSGGATLEPQEACHG